MRDVKMRKMLKKRATVAEKQHEINENGRLKRGILCDVRKKKEEDTH